MNKTFDWTYDPVLERKKDDFLDRNIFCGLRNLNTGFDVPSIKYFSEEDFRIVLKRVEATGIGIHGIEPWRDGEFYDVWTAEDFRGECTDPEWYRFAFEEFVSRGIRLQYAASYYIPDNLLNEEK